MKKIPQGLLNVANSADRRYKRELCTQFKGIPPKQDRVQRVFSMYKESLELTCTLLEY
jgi:hypothetical protein